MSNKLMKIQTALDEKADQVRDVANTVEQAGGALAAGYAEGRFGERGAQGAGVLGLVLGVAGMALEQPDIASFGKGLGFGYLALRANEAGAKARKEAIEAESKEQQKRDAAQQPAQQQPPQPEAARPDAVRQAGRKAWEDVMAGNIWQN